MTEERQQIDRINTAVNSQTSLLDQALALIEGKAAGGGGGSSASGLQVATGSFTPTTCDIYNAPIKITGLGFTPKYVYITKSTKYGATNTGTAGATATTFLLCVMFPVNENGTETSEAIAYNSKLVTAYNKYTITFNADGFILQPTSTSHGVSINEYFYTAIG